MTHDIHDRVRRALDAEVDAILASPRPGQLAPDRLARIMARANGAKSATAAVPLPFNSPPDQSVVYDAMAARRGNELPADLEQELRAIEDVHDEQQR